MKPKIVFNDLPVKIVVGILNYGANTVAVNTDWCFCIPLGVSKGPGKPHTMGKRDLIYSRWAAMLDLSPIMNPIIGLGSDKQREWLGLSSIQLHTLNQTGRHCGRATGNRL